MKETNNNQSKITQFEDIISNKSNQSRKKYLIGTTPDESKSSRNNRHLNVSEAMAAVSSIASGVKPLKTIRKSPRQSFTSENEINSARSDMSIRSFSSSRGTFGTAESRYNFSPHPVPPIYHQTLHSSNGGKVAALASKFSNNETPNYSQIKPKFIRPTGFKSSKETTMDSESDLLTTFNHAMAFFSNNDMMTPRREAVLLLSARSREGLSTPKSPEPLGQQKSSICEPQMQDNYSITSARLDDNTEESDLKQSTSTKVKTGRVARLRASLIIPMDQLQFNDDLLKPGAAGGAKEILRRKSLLNRKDAESCVNTNADQPPTVNNDTIQNECDSADSIREKSLLHQTFSTPLGKSSPAILLAEPTSDGSCGVEKGGGRRRRSLLQNKDRTQNLQSTTLAEYEVRYHRTL